MKISVVIITYNEEHNIGRCLQAIAGIADEMLVVDSFSTDKTTDIAHQYHAKVVQQEFRGYISQKNFATDEAKHDWILSIDADEVVSTSLANSILQIKEKGAQYHSYQCNRMANYCGTWIRHGGWYPDRKTRFFDRRQGTWKGSNNLHEKWQPHATGKTGRLKGDLLHYTFNTISEHLQQIDRFTDIMAKTLAENGKKTSILKVIFSSAWRFFNDYVLHLGFLDGYAGYLVCRYSAFATQVKYSKLKQYAKAGKTVTCNNDVQWTVLPAPQTTI